ncbi:bacteriophage recombination protein [Mizugakiibacter sediminis]|uniref:Bacteriophage recombination protein n=2 Tax=Mizugakiibacter sediminis TaxID=1475481 RepID=A0A0K8QR11_9GAMM|nr:recombinase RecT [Mizugakiibacter sediminis]GAP67359.1 bacteriophage recombination protein [Mizugakiibacter sediminis]
MLWPSEFPQPAAPRNPSDTSGAVGTYNNTAPDGYPAEDDMNSVATIEQSKSVGVLATLASHYGMDKGAFVQTIKATVMNGTDVSNEQLAAFCLVAKEHKLNPFTKEIFAFPSRGGIVPVVSVDGWMKLINSHPDFDGMEFKDNVTPDGQLLSITCRMFRKGRSHPVEVTEYMAECKRNTDVWRQWPARMLRHKATIQAARYAFGFAGIMEQDEAERMGDIDGARKDENVVPGVFVEDKRKARHDEAAEQYAASIELIKDRISEWDATQDSDALYTAAEAWAEIPSAAQMDLWLAPTKGGIFTTHERDVIKSKLPKIEQEKSE